MIIPGPPKRIDYGSHVVYIEGPDRIWQLGPLSIEFSRCLGPTFWIGEHNCVPRRCSPWWLLWRVIRRRLQEDK